MSTKDLSRTVIEGGRRRYNRDRRRHSHRIERGAWRRFASDMRGLPRGEHRRDRPIAVDVFDASFPERRPHEGRAFYDKLAPMERWLRSFVGRPWRVVHSRIFEVFETRTLAGRHIVFDHLLRSVDVDGSVPWAPFFVDRHGLLREHSRRRRRHRFIGSPPRWAVEWIGARKVGERGSKTYWFTPVEREYSTIIRYRQAHELDPDELARWRSLSEEHRATFRVDLDAGSA